MQSSRRRVEGRAVLRPRAKGKLDRAMAGPSWLGQTGQKAGAGTRAEREAGLDGPLD
jgi:hypothetical protein